MKIYYFRDSDDSGNSINPLQKREKNDNHRKLAGKSQRGKTKETSNNGYKDPLIPFELIATTFGDKTDNDSITNQELHLDGKHNSVSSKKVWDS